MVMCSKYYLENVTREVIDSKWLLSSSSNLIYEKQFYLFTLDGFKDSDVTFHSWIGFLDP